MNPCMQSKVLFPRFFKTQKVCFVGHLPESESNTSSQDSLKNGVSLPQSKQSGRLFSEKTIARTVRGDCCHQGQGPCHVAVLTLLMSLLPYDQLSIPFILNFLFLKTREKLKHLFLLNVFYYTSKQQMFGILHISLQPSFGFKGSLGK